MVSDHTPSLPCLFNSEDLCKIPHTQAKTLRDRRQTTCIIGHHYDLLLFLLFLLCYFSLLRRLPGLADLPLLMRFVPPSVPSYTPILPTPFSLEDCPSSTAPQIRVRFPPTTLHPPPHPHAKQHKLDYSPIRNSSGGLTCPPLSPMTTSPQAMKRPYDDGSDASNFTETQTKKGRPSSNAGSPSTQVPSIFTDPTGKACRIPTISRKVRACSACKKQKIRCDFEDGESTCVRCKKMKLECVVNRSLQTILDEDVE